MGMERHCRKMESVFEKRRVLRRFAIENFIHLIAVKSSARERYQGRVTHYRFVTGNELRDVNVRRGKRGREEGRMRKMSPQM